MADIRASLLKALREELVTVEGRARASGRQELANAILKKKWESISDIRDYCREVLKEMAG